MLYRIGTDEYIRKKDILGIFNYNNIIHFVNNKEILKENKSNIDKLAKKDKEIKSLILLDNGDYYLSTVGIKTLEKRWSIK
ncbi:MAG: extracellular matrix/biofilm biosynthesis regulator RemA family protein [bacterium]